MTDTKKVTNDDVITGESTGCCGGGMCGNASSDDGVVIEEKGCCGGGHCHDEKEESAQEHHHGGGCCGGDGQELTLTPEQITQVNDILGDIDDEDLASGNYDLKEEDLEKLRAIFSH